MTSSKSTDSPVSGMARRLLRVVVTSMLAVSFLLAAACATSTNEAVPAHKPPSGAAPSSAPKSPSSTPSPNTSGGGKHGELLVHGSGVFVHVQSRTGAHRIPAGGGFQLNFVNTDVKTVVTAVLTQGLGMPVVVDPGVSGTMNLQADQPLSASQVMASLELGLRSMGFVLIKVSGVFHVMPAKDAVRHVDGLKMAGNLHSGFGVYVVPLKFISARKMAEIIRPFAPDGGIVRIDSARNLLFLSGTDQEIRELRSVIRMFDVNWLAGMSFALYPAQYTSTTTLAHELRAVFGGSNSPIAGMIRFVPLKRINSLLVVTQQPKYLPLVDSWINRFDVGSMTPGRHLFVYDVQNGRASDLARSLEEIFSLPITSTGGSTESNTSGDPSAPGGFNTPDTSMSLGYSNSSQGFSTASPGSSSTTYGNGALGPFNRSNRGTPKGSSSIVTAGTGSSEGLKIVPDSDNNSLLIYAKTREFRMIKAALKRLDVLPLEVVINASIAEVTLNHGLQYGLNFSYNSSHGPITLSSTGSAAISRNFPGLSFLYTGGTNITAVLNALESITNVQVLSSPKLVVLNNHPAELEVGDEVPIVTQTSVSTVASNAPIVNSVQMLNTGVILQVVPRANESGQVILNISQEVSDVVPTTTSNIDSPTVEQRQISTTVAIHDGDTIVLGGLIQDSRSTTRSGIPYLRRLPVIGNLFGSTNNTDTRTELIVLLTPHVVHSAKQVDAVMSELREEFGELRNRIPN